MRILDLTDLPHRPIDAHGSRGFSVGWAVGTTRHSLDLKPSDPMNT